MDGVRYGLALVVLMTVPGGLMYWFSIHPSVRFWRSVGVGATLTALLAIIHVEERELRDRFGEEYVRYCDRIPRFWPW